MATKMRSIPWRRGTLTALFALGLVLQVDSVRAQTELELQIPSSALACLHLNTGEGEAPIYPPQELTAKVSAVLQVQLTFHSADSKPQVKVLKNTGTEAFADAVEAFVSRYRLPCYVNSSASITATQNFVFEPGDGRKVVYSDVSGEAPVELGLACFNIPKVRPPYPTRAASAGEGGTVLAEILFREANAEPAVRIIYDARSARLAAAVTKHMKDYRLICPMPSAEPVKATQAFVFEISEQDRYVFKDLDLFGFLRMVKPTDLIHGKFNLNTMGCPFDVSLRVRKPYADNVVGEYGQTDLRRIEFLNWVKGLTVKLPPDLEPYLFNQQMKVSVPCTRLDF